LSSLSLSTSSDNHETRRGAGLDMGTCCFKISFIREIRFSAS
jgi:hypothetical protein